MENLDRIAIFTRVVEAKSFSAAVLHAGMSKSLVSKQITQLEKSVGARLLNRTTRAMSLTEAGSAFYRHCVHIMAQCEAARREVCKLQSEPSGVLRISVPVAFGTLHIAPALPGFLSVYPNVKLDVSITNRFVDLAREGYDLAVRVGSEPAQNLMARRLATVKRTICATPAYFARYGVPQAPSDLERHNCLTHTILDPQDVWRLQGPAGEISVHATGNLRLSDITALSHAALSGFGVAMLPTFLICQQLKAGTLRPVLCNYFSVERHVYAVYLANHHLSANVRAFIDYLLQRFGPEPYWDRAQLSAGFT